jgi:RNA polymerase sigma-70 factor (ECF subfamily)
MIALVKEDLLLKRCRKGEVSAQRQVYDKYKSIWFTIALRYLRNRDDASDALQNALVNIYTKLDTFNQDQGSFKSWSCRIVVNESIMYQRKYWKHNTFAEIEDDMIWLDSSNNPESNLSAEELLKLIQKLPDGYRVVFNMYAIEGYSHKEIADYLNVSEGTSKSQLSKAKKLLRAQIEEMFKIRNYA